MTVEELIASLNCAKLREAGDMHVVVKKKSSTKKNQTQVFVLREVIVNRDLNLVELVEGR